MSQKQTPYVDHFGTSDGDPEATGWYAVDAYGATDGPHPTKEDAEAKLATLPPDHFEP